MYFWPDYYYIILVVPAIIISLIAQANVKGTYKKMARVPNRQGLTGEMAAQRVLSYYGITNVRIEQVGGSLTDHYDPRSNVIRLSPQVFAGSSIASVGIACHEAGHAAQHAENYVPIKIRNKILPFANIGSSVGIWIAIIGYFLNFGILVDIGIILFACVVLFQLVTLPIEFNASIRAMKVIDETGMLYAEEQSGAKKVLRAAAMTYVASLLTAIASLLRLILRFNNKNRR
ncbi:MAG: zinc metallopeptidase [Faecalibacterium sp.]|nr:zinc metallopeptidase [Ruminococcus sp.]MCM1392228.1 zinc metallopeptidase [Ruminococcus sp.]MCM1484931.1 zinc metallopeptidase [Faecalibacterium sp.]